LFGNLEEELWRRG